MSILVNSGKCTVQLTEHTGRELYPPEMDEKKHIFTIKLLNNLLLEHDENSYH